MTDCTVTTAAPEPLRVLMRVHGSELGTCWADSPHLRGYTAAGRSVGEVMNRLKETFTDDFVACMVWGHLDPKVIDLRWQWCDSVDRPVVAITGDPGGWIGRPAPVCGCDIEAGSAP